MLFISRFKLEFSFMKQKVISQDSSSSVVKVQVLGVEVPGSNSGKFFSTFLCTFLPRGDCCIRVFQSSDFTLVWFLLYSFVL